MRNKYVVLLCVLICLTVASISLFVLYNNTVEQKDSAKNIQLPQIVSNVEGVKVLNTKIESASQDQDLANIELQNTSDKPIVAVVIESGDASNASGIVIHKFRNEKDNAVIIEPHSTINHNLSIKDLQQGAARVSGVMYSDGSVEGEAVAIDRIERYKNYHKAANEQGAKQP